MLFRSSLYSNKSSKCRKLHNIANSVIIFDEAQMLPTAHLLPCVGAIANLVTHFNVTAVLCTATQPVLNDLIRSFCPKIEVKEICPDTVGLYDRFRRVTFRNGGNMTNAELAMELGQQNQTLCIVNTRKAAQQIYQLLPSEGSFHLSTLMYPAHRQAVLKTVRERLKQGAPCRVVSTSLIEAGVDVDFPTVYRELSGLDSILQAAGRCNREGKRNAAESIVTYFEGGLSSSIISAILAAIILVEVVNAMPLSRKSKIDLTIIACFSIGLGAALTPLGEPLSTIAVSKLAGEPYNADFLFLFNMLGKYIFPGVFAFGLLGVFFLGKADPKAHEMESADYNETVKDVVMRAIKVYVFIAALVLLGEG